MPLRPHLHLLISSATVGVLLEARVYPLFSKTRPQPSLNDLALTTSTRSQPVNPHGPLNQQLEEALRSWEIKQLIIAAHPWQKLGGNMLDPVLSHCLVEAAAARADDIAIVTYNVRGVGRSGGSMGWLGLSTSTNERDFAAIERYFVDLLQPSDLRRVGYSMGSILALNAPKADPVVSTLLISPPTTIFGLTTLLSSRTFNKALKEAGEVKVIHGTEDQFTSLAAYQALARAGGSVECWLVDGADHFYRDERSIRLLIDLMQRWMT